MAEKQAILIKYKYLRFIENAHISDSDSWILIKSIIEYDEKGIEPLYQNSVLYGLFAAIKYDIDQNRENWEKVSETNSENGSKGGAPKGNQNALKYNRNNRKQPLYNQNNPIQPIACNSPVNNPNNQIQHDSDLVSDHDSEFDHDSESSQKINKSGGGDLPQPLLINKIREEARKLDIILGTDLAAKAAATGIESAWLDGAFNFPAFVLERLRENPEYRRKPRHEMALLFAAAFAWENLRQEYPLWKQGKEHELEELEKMKIMEEALETARMNHPQKCGECGKELTEYDGEYWCKFCNTYYSLDEKTLKWERGK